ETLGCADDFRCGTRCNPSLSRGRARLLHPARSEGERVQRLPLLPVAVLGHLMPKEGVPGPSSVVRQVTALHRAAGALTQVDGTPTIAGNAAVADDRTRGRSNLDPCFRVVADGAGLYQAVASLVELDTGTPSRTDAAAPS